MGVLKTFTDILFFYKNTVTTAALVNETFHGPDDVRPVYPTENFDDNTTIIESIALTEQELINTHSMTLPSSLGQATIGNNNEVTSATNIFENAVSGDFLLYKLTSETGIESLKVLGIIDEVISDLKVLLHDNAPVPNSTIVDVYYLDKDDNILNFKFDDNFYMVVKNTNYTGTNHDGVLAIDRNKTSSPTSSPLMAFSNSRQANTIYFKLQRMSKKNSPGESEIQITYVPCSIIGLSKYSEKSLFQNLVSSIPVGEIPYWSVYEVNPHLTSTTNLDKNTFFRLVIPDVLPSDQVFVQTGQD